MSNILSASQRAAFASGRRDVFDTFARPILIYQEPQITYISTAPAEHWNPIDGYNQNATGVSIAPVYTTISGCILYDKIEETPFLTPFNSRGVNEAAIKVRDGNDNRSMRLKVDGSGYNLLKTAKKAEVDGFMFDVSSKPRPHGLFEPQYWTFYFERTE